MRTVDNTVELFPTPDWRRRWVRVTTPPAGTFLRLTTAKGRIIEGTLVAHEQVRAGVLVSIDTGDTVEEVVVPRLEVTIPLPLDGDQLSA